MLDRMGAIARKASLADSIVHEFIHLVETGAVRPGDRLPNENELAEAWGVGRSSVREAFRVFQLLGVIESRPARGTFLSNVAPLYVITDWSRFSDVSAITEIIEARIIMETGVIRLAAERATEEDFRKLEEALAQCEAAGESTEAGIQASLDFHQAVVEAAHNEILLLNTRLLRAFYYEAYRGSQRGHECAECLLRDHQRILEAIKARDPDLAAQVMLEHMRNGTSFLLRKPLE